MKSPFVVLAVVLITAGCGDEATAPSAAVSALEIVSGDSQADTVARLLAQPLVVRAVTSGGRPIQGLAVQFSVTRGQGSVFSRFDVTDRNGEAHERWTLGPVAGEQEVTAHTVNEATGKMIKARFVATAQPDSVARIEVWPDPQAEAHGDTIVVADSLQFFANAFDRFDNFHSDSGFFWIVSHPTLASISFHGGLLVPIMDRDVVVMASKEGIFGTDTVWIWFPPRDRLALAFRAVDESPDYVEVPDAPSLDLTTSWTLEAWVKPWAAGASGTHRAIHKGHLELAIDNDHLEVVWSGDSIAQAWSSHTILNDLWQHVAVSFNHGTLTIYVNGIQETPIDSLTTPVATSAPLVFSAWTRYYRGLLDEIRVWNVARTIGQIQYGMTREINPAEPGLVGYWRFNDGSGDVAVDLTQYHNDGHLGSMVGRDDNDPRWTTDSAPISPQGGSSQ